MIEEYSIPPIGEYLDGWGNFKSSMDAPEGWSKMIGNVARLEQACNGLGIAWAPVVKYIKCYRGFDQYKIGVVVKTENKRRVSIVVDLLNEGRLKVRSGELVSTDGMVTVVRVKKSDVDKK
ncbi:hypothetical protein [Caenispirillum bisanense]|nr:hypothetical protein [Caenispirillum bisanense]